ncbi:MAG: hypothetical protein IJB96_06750 [Lachnospira sp.]|nr:hypothetical protein [Lachnospira sp.]
MGEKKNIYYARTYRRIKIDIKKSIIFTCLMIIPAMILFIANIDFITEAMTSLAYNVLQQVIPAKDMSIGTSSYSILGKVTYLELPTKYPAFSTICWNLLLCLVVIFLLQIIKKAGRPVAVFVIFSMLIHVANCIFFILAPEEFPYSLSMYSDIYLKQQLGIWMAFILLSGLVVGFLGEGRYLRKVITFFGIMAYSAVFGVIRYILFMYLLYEFSVFYMALLFFVIGPMFDFSYVVSIYAIFVNKTIKDYEYGSKKGAWEWS